MAIEPVVRPGHKGVSWKCRCVCGKIILLRSKSFALNLPQRSCGCVRREECRQMTLARTERLRQFRKTEEGHMKYVWYSMLRRCRNKNNPNYAGRGITICERWLNYENFRSDMGLRPTTKHTIDRIDVNGNYEPQNCRWATPTEQASNRRNTIFVEINGERKTISQWAKLAGIPTTTIENRIRSGWTELQLIGPLQRKRKQKT